MIYNQIMGREAIFPYAVSSMKSPDEELLSEISSRIL